MGVAADRATWLADEIWEELERVAREQGQRYADKDMLYEWYHMAEELLEEVERLEALVVVVEEAGAKTPDAAATRLVALTEEGLGC